MSASVDGGLAGREREIAHLTAFIAEAARTGGALVLVGEPGVGKTALIDAVLSRCGHPGRVVRIIADTTAAQRAYSAVNDLLARLADSPNAPGGSVTAATAATAMTATVAAVRAAAPTVPLLVVVDGAEHLDEQSALVIAFLARRLHGSRVALIIAGRPDATTFTARIGLPRLILRPLDRGAAESLLRRRFPDLAAEVAARVMDDAGGLPPALLELPAALSRDERAGDEPLPPTLPLTAPLVALFHRAVPELSAEGRELLMMAALDGTDDLGLLRSAAGRDIAGPLAELEATGAMVETAAGRLRFSHPLIRSAVVSAAGAQARARAHDALAAALVNRPDRRAWHLAEASAAVGDLDASLMFERAARESELRGDIRETVAALIRAASLHDRPSERARLLAAAARIEADVRGDLPAATRLLDRARWEDPRSGHTLPAVTANAVLLLSERGGVTAAHDQLVAALRQAGDAADARVLHEALWMLIQISWFDGRLEMWASMRELITLHTARLPAYLRLAGPISAGPAGMTRDVVRELDAAISGLAHEIDPVVIVRTAFVADGVDRGWECHPAVRRVYQAGPAGGALVSVIFATVILSDFGFSSGDWDEAERLAEDGLRLCGARDHVTFAWQLRYRKALLSACRGDSQTARSMAAEMLEWAERGDLPAVRGRAHHVLALDALGRGDAEAAYGYLERLGAMTARTENGAQMFAIDIVEAAAGAGRREDGPLAEFTRRLPAAGPSLMTAGAAAMNSADDGARELYERALSRPDAARFPFEQARVRLAFGTYLRRAHRFVEAQATLNAALRTFEQLRATPWTIRTVNELRASGQKVAANEAELAGLTSQQIQIARMAAGGMTNKQIGAELFLSDRTVGGHLAAIFRKLRVTSRVDLQDVVGISVRPG